MSLEANREQRYLEVIWLLEMIAKERPHAGVERKQLHSSSRDDM